jgi:hypothetical protein
MQLRQLSTYTVNYTALHGFQPFYLKTQTGSLFEKLCYAFVIFITLDDGQVKQLCNATYLYRPTPPSELYRTELVTQLHKNA